MKRILQEIKEAFPFFLSERVRKVKKSMEPAQKLLQWVTSPDNRLSQICKDSQLLPPVFPVSQWNCRCSSDLIHFPKEDTTIGHDLPEQINITPYYVATLALVALLALYGFACEIDLINFEPMFGVG